MTHNPPGQDGLNDDYDYRIPYQHGLIKLLQKRRIKFYMKVIGVMSVLVLLVVFILCGIYTFLL